MNQQRVFITGIGVMSPFGTGVTEFFNGIRAGQSATRGISLVRDAHIESQVAAEVPNFDPVQIMGSVEAKRVPRVVPMALSAAREALADSQIVVDQLSLDQRRRIGIILGTGGGGIEFAEMQYENFYGRGNRKVTPYCVSSSFVGMLSSEISIALGLHGPSHVVSTGCTSSTDAIGYAVELIKNGTEEILITGGAEACITRGILAGFSRMGVVSTKYNQTPQGASRPFDAGRDGFVLGEGAWMFVVESEKSAKARGAKLYAELVGYGSTCDAYHRVAAKQDGVEPARAMELALQRAKVSLDAVQCVHLHGTGTKMNDSVETRAIKLLFNSHSKKIPTTALKSMIGHPQGACGAAGVMAALFTLKEQFIPPTINYETPDPECDLDVTPNQGVTKDVEFVLCNTIAFGSKNSALVLKRATN